MKRSELKRRTPLSRETSKPLQRAAPPGRGNGQAGGPRRQEGLERAGRRKRKASIPPAIRLIVAARSNGCCIVCGKSRRQVFRMDRHHVFDEQLFPELAVIAENLVLCCDICHGRHTSAFAPIPVAKLPQCALDLAAGHPKREIHLERHYAAA